MRLEEDRDDIRIIGRLYVTSKGIRWYPKGVKDPPDPERYALTWVELTHWVTNRSITRGEREPKYEVSSVRERT